MVGWVVGRQPRRCGFTGDPDMGHPPDLRARFRLSDRLAQSMRLLEFSKPSFGLAVVRYHPTLFWEIDGGAI